MRPVCCYEGKSLLFCCVTTVLIFVDRPAVRAVYCYDDIIVSYRIVSYHIKRTVFSFY